MVTLVDDVETRLRQRRHHRTQQVERRHPIPGSLHEEHRSPYVRKMGHIPGLALADGHERVSKEDEAGNRLALSSEVGRDATSHRLAGQHHPSETVTRFGKRSPMARQEHRCPVGSPLSGIHVRIVEGDDGNSRSRQAVPDRNHPLGILADPGAVGQEDARPAPGRSVGCADGRAVPYLDPHGLHHHLEAR